MSLTRTWLTSWLFGHLSEAQANPALPMGPRAETMSDELIREWLAHEAKWWLAASQKPGLSMSQRSMRLAVSRFYDDRLLAMTNATPSQVVKPEAES